MNKQINEDSFEGAPGGVGSMNYANTLSTFNSPAVSQNSDQFYNSNNNKAVGSNSNTTKNGPDSGSMENDINKLYSKKKTSTGTQPPVAPPGFILVPISSLDPKVKTALYSELGSKEPTVAGTEPPPPDPDSIIAGIKFELSRMIKKDKFKAKEIVMQNLLKRPDFYSGLHQLNIDDKDLVSEKKVNMTEHKHPNDAPAKLKVSANSDETKKIFEDMVKSKDQKYVVNSGICDVMKQMWVAKKQRSDWKKG